MRAAQEAERSCVPVDGIKGTSVLAEALDLVDGIPVDYMHAVQGFIQDFQFGGGEMLCVG